MKRRNKILSCVIAFRENRKNIVSLWNVLNSATKLPLEWEYEGVFNNSRMFINTHSLLENLVTLSDVFHEEMSQSRGSWKEIVFIVL